MKSVLYKAVFLLHKWWMSDFLKSWIFIHSAFSTDLKLYGGDMSGKVRNRNKWISNSNLAVRFWKLTMFLKKGWTCESKTLCQRIFSLRHGFLAQSLYKQPFKLMISHHLVLNILKSKTFSVKIPARPVPNLVFIHSAFHISNPVLQ